MKSYEYILLDWDGNLAKTLDVWLIATRAPFEKRGIAVTDKQVASCFGIPRRRYTDLGIIDVDTALEEMDEMAAKLLPEVDLYPDALTVLDSLKKSGKKTALITTSLKSNVLRLLDKYDLHHFFDVLVAYEDTNEHKPHPEPLLKALQRLGSGDLDRAVMIGDSDKDIEAARNAKIDSILFFPDEHKKFYDLDALKEFSPTHIVRDFREIIGIVQTTN